MTTFREFGAQSAHFGKNWGYDKSRGAQVFLCVVIQSTFGNFATADFNQIWPQNVVWCTIDESGMTFSKIFTLGVICPQNLKSKVGQTGSSLWAGTGCTAERMFTPRCSPRAREFPRSINFSVRRAFAELRVVKVAHFGDFSLFSSYKTPKTYLPMTSLQPRVYIAKWLRYYRMLVEGPKGCLPAAEFSCKL